MRIAQALTSGFAGATALTLVHEVSRRMIPHAPRMDVIGMRALARALRAADQRPPDQDVLYRAAMVGDLISNGVYYSLVGLGDGRRAWRRGALLGLLAGVGGAFLPRLLGLGRQPGSQAPTTHLLTIAWYLVGGLVAAAVARRVHR